MVIQENAGRLARCPEASCLLHARGTGCRVADGIPAAEVPSLLRTGGGIDQPTCVLIDVLCRTLGARAQAESPRDSLGRLYLLLDHVGKRVSGERRLDVGYLVTVVSRAAVDELRRDAGRPRCGGCTSYGWISRRCLARGSPYLDALPPDTEPHRLTPVCREFHPLRVRAKEDLSSVPVDDANDAVQKVGRALELLGATDRPAAALLVEVHLEGRSLRELAKELHVDRRRLKLHLERAEERLGYILEDLP